MFGRHLDRGQNRHIVPALEIRYDRMSDIWSPLQTIDDRTRKVYPGLSPCIDLKSVDLRSGNGAVFIELLVHTCHKS